ncbi:N-acetylmuramoyl-L-alanine amidase [hydrothermal vent metagenome]|uniref:N-acetylmuramoyl-L-alanine amidase n=1 Tax=hydrothermal vent metagenome TaxID=652676 RepID=A0A1W1CXE7_9ZZZZ
MIKKTILIVFFVSFFTSTIWAKKDNYLKSTNLTGNTLTLTFKYKLDDVKFFTLKNRGIIKYVYDIKNAVLPNTIDIKKYRHTGVVAFRIGQFSKKYLRIVIESKYTHYKTYSIHGKVLTLNLPKIKNPKKIDKYSPIVIIDAGHGGYDIGASHGKIIEKKITLALALKLQKKLSHRGYKVYMTRKSDKHLYLYERSDYANMKKGKIFISLHLNAAPKRKHRNYIYKGIEIFYMSGASKKKRYSNKKIYTSKWKKEKSYLLGKAIKNKMLKSVRKKYTVLDKGLKENNFWVIRGTKMPAILIENGYLTDKYEGKRLTTNSYQNLLVEGIAKGVDVYFNRK